MSDDCKGDGKVTTEFTVWCAGVRGVVPGTVARLEGGDVGRVHPAGMGTHPGAVVLQALQAPTVIAHDG